jgi:hypothetical protein
MTENQDGTHRVLAQADALMRRHRVFVAGGNATTEATENPPSQDDDIPVLTEVVAEVVAESSSNESPPPVPVQELLDSQRAKIEQTIEQWLDEKLPEEVLRVMDGISDQLIGSLVTRMRNELLPQLLLANPLSDAEASATNGTAETRK